MEIPKMMKIEPLSFAVDFSQRLKKRRKGRALAQLTVAKANVAFNSLIRQLKQTAKNRLRYELNLTLSFITAHSQIQ
jgi:hypothetical protein